MKRDPEDAIANEPELLWIKVDDPVTANDPDIYRALPEARRGDNICSNLISAIYANLPIATTSSVDTKVYPKTPTLMVNIILPIPSEPNPVIESSVTATPFT